MIITYVIYYKQNTYMDIFGRKKTKKCKCLINPFSLSKNQWHSRSYTANDGQELKPMYSTIYGSLKPTNSRGSVVGRHHASLSPPRGPESPTRAFVQYFRQPQQTDAPLCVVAAYDCSGKLGIIDSWRALKSIDSKLSVNYFVAQF